ncbi:hypothetical protein AAJ76_5000015645 [Vairimorpha ceranae]|uniref:Rho-GAP domain-containing protein n=1 Tax=Vairimorpha ceranae TaxID=40302 RepID=A0A0F9WNX8_9MICR|nr:hypothetical protein AAJ76_5000015645 [Vairimorpha ceranae]KAF5140406.1 hypothetical protein G9O61_00g014220 [Vairimorpha ceranae]KKO74703.1 hypothetical protein AAJ76_5000015645 [Vairimorpha ceranae]
MSRNSKMPAEIDVKTNDFFKKRDINIYRSDVIKNYKLDNVDNSTNFTQLPTKDKEYITNFCKKQFELELSNSYFHCFKVKNYTIIHKNINPKIFEVLDVINHKIKHLLEMPNKDNLDELKNLFRVDDKGLDISDADFENKKLSQLCTLVKKYILNNLDGLFDNRISMKLLRSYKYNKVNYGILISYVPFILSHDELKLLESLLSLFLIIDKHKEYTHMTITGLIRLFSLVLFDSKCFTSLETLLYLENILIDIFRLDFSRIPKTLVKRIFKCV